MNLISVAVLSSLILGLIDLYVYQGVKILIKNFSPRSKKVIFYLYWGIVAIILPLFVGSIFFPEVITFRFGDFVFIVIILYFPKTLAALFLVLDDIIRFVKWILRNNSTAKKPLSEEICISRSEFLIKTAALVSVVPVVGTAYGTVFGAYDFRIRRQTILLPELPSVFDGIRIGQISDIHSGSFFNNIAVKRGVQMLINEKPDLIFFTGDLVNSKANEMYQYQGIFDKIKAPLGVYSILGNHDYGDNVKWASQQAKINNFNSLLKTHKAMGWKLLRNGNAFIDQAGEKIAILGVENWSKKGFSQYGDIHKAYQGTQEAAVKLLLSHDPSHWDAHVRPLFPDISVTFSGHTHGSQIGVEIGNVRWSPSQFNYEQWAGLYKQDRQYLYVNRGFGFIGIPARVGIPPEITVIELKKGT